MITAAPAPAAAPRLQLDGGWERLLDGGDNSTLTNDDGQVLSSLTVLLCTFVQALDPSLTVNATTDSLLTADPCEDFSDELVLGCTDAAADNFNVDATVSDGSPAARLHRSAAVNFNSRATDDDGSCALPRAGCAARRRQLRLGRHRLGRLV